MTQSNLFQDNDSFDAHYIEIAINRPLFQTFTYSSKEPTKIGQRVLVKIANSHEVGIVVNAHSQKPETTFNISPIEKVIDTEPTISNEIIKLLSWSASYYFQPLGEMLFTFIPNYLKQPKPLSSLFDKSYRKSTHNSSIEALPSNAKKQIEALTLLEQSSPLALSTLKKRGISSSTINQLISKKLINEELTKPLANKSNDREPSHDQVTPNPEQATAIQAICKSKDKFNCFLLEGVTGSGKTEVYIQVSKYYLERNQQVLILVPEIGLTPQLSQHLTAKLNAPIITLHSDIANKERAKRWLTTQNNNPFVVLGTRSAVACSMPNLGCIIIDEEHDASFKQQEGTRYHSRSIAIKRAQIDQIPIVLGSATPSLESLNNQNNQLFKHLTLNKRALGNELPSISLEDTSNLLQNQIFNAQTIHQIENTLKAGHQALVFINRRGFAPTMQCTQCHWVAECEQCDTSLTIHKNTNTLECHHCETVTAIPKHCPNCHSPYLSALGYGTERIENELQSLFPKNNIIRMDRDSTQNKGSLERIREQLLTGQPCILVGTQMVSKGHDFPNLTLTVILNTDNGLYSQDYRAKELLIQNLIQVSGRSGRGQQPGQVIIQTNYPEHPILQFAIHQDYKAFSENELKNRETLRLPPFHYSATLRMQSLLDNNAYSKLCNIEQQLKAKYSNMSDIEISATMPALIEKKSNWYRYLIMISSPNRRDLHRALSDAQQLLIQQPRSRKLKWVIDVDPLDMS